jgi:hypothetical protein
MNQQGFDELADAITVEMPRVRLRKGRASKRAQDRSRDHAVYAAPHRPPASSAPVFETDLLTVRRARAPERALAPAHRGPPIAAVVLAIVATLMSFGIAMLTHFAP